MFFVVQDFQKHYWIFFFSFFFILSTIFECEHNINWNKQEKKNTSNTKRRNDKRRSKLHFSSYGVSFLFQYSLDLAAVTKRSRPIIYFFRFFPRRLNSIQCNERALWMFYRTHRKTLIAYNNIVRILIAVRLFCLSNPVHLQIIILNILQQAFPSKI